MKHPKPFLHINKDLNLDQIHIDSFNAIARTLSQTSLNLVDFKRVQQLRNIDYQTATREYMLLKTGMFDMWEVLYHYDQ